MFDELKSALEATGIPTAEGDWDRAPQSGPYLTIALTGETSSVWGSDRQRQQAHGGSVHLFDRTDDKQRMLQIQDILRAQGVSWYLASVQHEPRNNIVHYEWIFDLEEL